MEVKKTYYRDLDIVRLILCLLVLLYHLNILKGGFLAVCSFFVLSGYLSCLSAFNKEKFSILDYYKNRLLKIYLPLLIVVFITIFVISLFNNIIWITLKPETTSVIFGYNNFWQLNVNMDYFANHINSPFMHLWYVSILLQFELIFPLLFLLLKKIGDKIHKIVPIILLIILSVLSTIFFYRANGIMNAYYNTFARIFSLIFGFTLAFIHIYFRKLIPKKLQQKPINNLIYIFYLTLLITLCFTISSTSKYLMISMIFVSVITLRLIDYGTIITKEKLSIIDKMIRSFSSISYEIYLVQYPIIFLFEYISISYIDNYKLFIIIIIIVIVSYILYFAINNLRKLKILKLLLCIMLSVLSLFGIYKYIIEKDHTSEMKALEEQLLLNEAEMLKKQEDFMLNFKQENDDYNKLLNQLETDEKSLADFVTNLPVIGIGDSVMLGATSEFYKKFPNGYFDAKVSRTAWAVNGILRNLKNINMLGNPIIINLGANGDCSEDCKKEIMRLCQDKEVFWINVTNDIDVNSKLESLSKIYSNLHIVDWNSISKNHLEYFISDGIHLTAIGKVAYTDAVYNSIYNFYLKKYTDKKQELVDKHNQKLKTKISFYGNDILLNVFDNIKGTFDDANFVINKNFTFELLKEQIEKYIEEETLTYKIVFAFDNNIISKNEYQEIIELCKEHKIYIVSVNEDLSSLNSDNVKIIDFSHQVQQYLMADKRHLNTEGNIALGNLLIKSIH